MAQGRDWRSRSNSISGSANPTWCGPRHIQNGELTDFDPQKTSRTGGKLITVPLHPDTRVMIAATPLTSTDTFLVTSFGKPFTTGLMVWLKSKNPASEAVRREREEGWR